MLRLSRVGLVKKVVRRGGTYTLDDDDDDDDVVVVVVVVVVAVADVVVAAAAVGVSGQGIPVATESQEVLSVQLSQVRLSREAARER